MKIKSNHAVAATVAGIVLLIGFILGFLANRNPYVAKIVQAKAQESPVNAKEIYQKLLTGGQVELMKAFQAMDQNIQELDELFATNASNDLIIKKCNDALTYGLTIMIYRNNVGRKGMDTMQDMFMFEVIGRVKALELVLGQGAAKKREAEIKRELGLSVSDKACKTRWQ